jgi:hypothetical protein
MCELPHTDGFQHSKGTAEVLLCAAKRAAQSHLVSRQPGSPCLVSHTPVTLIIAQHVSMTALLQEHNAAQAQACNSSGRMLFCCRLDGQGIIARFVVGHSGDARAEAAMQQEVARHGDFLQLDVTVRLAFCQQPPKERRMPERL